jgi:hypothetical protein
MGLLDAGSGPRDTRSATTGSRTPGPRFVVGITVAVVAFAAIVAFAMYWLAPLT